MLHAAATPTLDLTMSNFAALAVESTGDLLTHLIHAAGAWLHYETICQNDVLLYEDSLRHAVGVALKSLCTPLGTLHRNCDHPGFAEVLSVRKCDLGVISANGDLEVALEVKWVDSDQPSKWIPRILQDMLRLALAKGKRSVLLIAGEQRHLSGLFSRREFLDIPGHDISNPDGKIHGLLPIGICPFDSLASEKVAGPPQALSISVSEAIALLTRGGRKEIEEHFKDVPLPSTLYAYACHSYGNPIRWMTTMKYNAYGWSIGCS